MRKLSILNLEDDPLDAEPVSAALEEGSVDCEIVRVQTRGDFIAALEKESFDLILADYALPSFDGATALQLARERWPSIPFAFVSGTIGEEIAIEAVKGGATDYVLKQRLSRLAPAAQRAVREADERAARKRAEEFLRRIREAERARMARDLHDGPLQDIVYASAEVQVAMMTLGEREAQDRLQTAVEILRRASGELREAVYDLRPDGESERPLCVLLGEIVRRTGAMMPDCAVTLDVLCGDAEAHLERHKRELVRIVQEALTNARRHSGATNIRVSLTGDRDRAVIKVVDDGRGIPETFSPGVGLRSMQERAAILGGELLISSTPGSGTTVTLELRMGGNTLDEGAGDPRAGEEHERQTREGLDARPAAPTARGRRESATYDRAETAWLDDLRDVSRMARDAGENGRFEESW